MPILIVAMLVFLGVVGWLLRVGLDVKGSALGTSVARQGDANIRVAPSSAPTEVPDSIANVTDAPGEVEIPQTGGASGAGGATRIAPSGAGGEAMARDGAPSAGARPGTAPQGVAPQVGGGGPASQGAGGPPAPVMRLLTEFRTALADNPRNISALVGLANLYFDAAKYAQALPYYRRALALDPTNPDTRTDYATALHGDGDDLPALAELRRVLAERPDFAQALFNEGVVDTAVGRRTDAGTAFRRFLKVAPNDAHAAQARAALAGLGPS